MNNMKVEIDKFDSIGDFRIWRRRIKGPFSQQKLLKTVKDPLVLPDDFFEDQKQGILETAIDMISFHLSDLIIRLID